MAKIYDAVLKLSADPFVKGLERAERQMEKFSSKYKDVSRKFKDASKVFSSAGSALTKAFTLPIVGAVSASIKTGKGFEEQMAKVSSISGATGKDLKSLSDLARKMGKETKFSAQEAAEGLQYMAMAGWDNKQMTEGLEPILNLAIASGEELGTTSDIVTDALTAFGLQAKDTAHFTDVLATASNSSNTSVSLLGESFKYVAPLAGAMGYSIEDTSIALGLMANAGIKGSKAGTALSNAIMKLNAPTKQTMSAMKELNISMADSEGNMRPLRDVMGDLRGSFKHLSKEQQAYYSNVLFGKEASAGMLSIINASSKDYEKLAGSIDNAAGMTEKMRKTMEDTLGGDWDKLKSGATEALIQTFEMIKEPLRNALKGITKLIDTFNNLDDKTKGKILKLVGNLALIGPTLWGIGKGLGGIKKGIDFFGKLSTEVGKAKGIVGLLTSPVGKLVLVLGAIALVAFLIINNWEKIKPFFDGLVSHFSKFAEKVKNFLAPIVDSLKSLFDAIKDFIENLILPKIYDSIQKLKGIWEWVWPILSSSIEMFMNVVGGNIQSVIGILDGIITFITGVFTGNWSKAWEGVKKIFSSIWENMKNTVKSILNGIIESINSVIRKIGSIKIPDWVPFAGGKTFSVPEIPKIGKNAMGTSAWSGGYTMVHEKGGEIVDLPTGTRILPHDKSVQEAYRSGLKNNKGGNNSTNINIPKFADTIIIREESDLDKLANKLLKNIQIAKANAVGV